MPHCLHPAPHPCSSCTLGSLCPAAGLPPHEQDVFKGLGKQRVQLGRGDFIYYQRDSVINLYIICSGSLKIQFEDASGRVQIGAFLLPSEMAGLDGYEGAHYQTHAVALEPTEVCGVLLRDIQREQTTMPTLHRRFLYRLNQRFIHSQQLLLVVAALRAEQRLAFFLLDWSRRMRLLGADPHQFALSMRREDIANHLGLTLETISRLLARFVREHLIRIHSQRVVQLLDMPMLRELSGANPRLRPGFVRH